MTNLPEQVFDLLTGAELALLPTLELRAQAIVHGLYAGLHKSPYHGTNAEFKEFREYFRGDPVTDIDWKVFARTNHLVIRMREDNSDLTAAIFVDGSASMSFQDRKDTLSKWDFASAIAAACMLILQEQKDRFTLMIPGRDKAFEKPSNTQAHLTHLLDKLRSRPEGKEFPIADAIADAADSLPAGAPVIVISDCYFDSAELQKSFGLLAAKHCTPIIFRVLTRSEIEFPYRDPVRFQDLETHEKLVFSPDTIREDYHQRLKKHLKEFDELAASCQGAHGVFLTDSVPVRALGIFLSGMNKRMRHH